MIPFRHGPLRLRLTGTYRWSLDVTGSTIKMVTGEAKLEYPLVVRKVELAPVAGKIDFYKSTASYTTFDGNAWHTRSVTHYFSPKERLVERDP